MLIWVGMHSCEFLLCREKKDSLVESLVQSSPFDVERRGECLPQDQILSRMVTALQRVSSGAPGELSMGRSVPDQCLPV